jgi:hypothetical protein
MVFHSEEVLRYFSAHRELKASVNRVASLWQQYERRVTELAHAGFTFERVIAEFAAARVELDKCQTIARLLIDVFSEQAFQPERPNDNCGI